MPWQIYVVCSNGQGVDGNLYHRLCTEIGMSGLMDLLEMAEVHTSWKHAELHNNEWRANLPK